jgi:hypothetical protein
VRRPGGAVAALSIPFFPGPQRVSVGSSGFGSGSGSARQTLIALHRPSGGDEDLYTVDLATGRQARVGPISSSAYDEGPVAVKYGDYVFVRRGGRRDGIYFWNGSGSARRISTVTPTQVVTNGSRAAYWTGRTVAVRRLSGEGALLTFRSPAAVRNVLLTRYRVIWLTADGRVFQSDRFGGSGNDSAVARAGRRPLPGAQSIADDGTTVSSYLDAAGVHSITPPLFG